MITLEDAKRAALWRHSGTCEGPISTSALATRTMEHCALAIEKVDEFGHDLMGLFFHEPVVGIANDHAFSVGCDKPALLNEEIARSYFAGQHKHGHGFRCGRSMRCEQRAGN